MKIRNGNKYDKTLMLKEMLARSKVKFIPMCYSEGHADASFYIEDVEAAKAVKVNIFFDCKKFQLLIFLICYILG